MLQLFFPPFLFISNEEQILVGENCVFVPFESRKASLSEGTSEKNESCVKNAGFT